MKQSVLFVLCICVLIALCSCASDPTSSPAGSSNEAEMEQTADMQETSESKILVDDEYITAEFKGFMEYDDLGVFYVNLKVDNKTDKTIWVYLDEASVNDEMVPMVMTGVPLNILPEKSGANSFIFSFGQLSISSYDEVKKVEFKIVVADENTMDPIETTDAIIIEK